MNNKIFPILITCLGGCLIGLAPIFVRFSEIGPSFTGFYRFLVNFARLLSPELYAGGGGMRASDGIGCGPRCAAWISPPPLLGRRRKEVYTTLKRQRN